VKNITEVARGWKEYYQVKQAEKAARQAEERRKAQKALDDAAATTEKERFSSECVMVTNMVHSFEEGWEMQDKNIDAIEYSREIAEANLVQARTAAAVLAASGGSDDEIRAANAKVTTAEANVNNIQGYINHMTQLHDDLEGNWEAYSVCQNEIDPNRGRPAQRALEQRNLDAIPTTQLERVLATRAYVRERITGVEVSGFEQTGIRYPETPPENYLDAYLRNLIAQRNQG
jgi:hypothetical protein